MYSDPRKALYHVKTLLKYNPTPKQLLELQERVKGWLTEAKQKDNSNPMSVGKCAAPYEWLYQLVDRVMAKEISFADAVNEIREYERE